MLKLLLTTLTTTKSSDQFRRMMFTQNLGPVFAQKFGPSQEPWTDLLHDVECFIWFRSLNEPRNYMWYAFRHRPEKMARTRALMIFFGPNRACNCGSGCRRMDGRCVAWLLARCDRNDAQRRTWPQVSDHKFYFWQLTGKTIYHLRGLNTIDMANS